MERRHTPGPWRIINGDLANKKFHQIVGPAILKSPIGEDDCNLIAAAPELLEVAYATRKLVSEAASVGFNCTDGDWAVRLYANQARLSAAIAKAEGRA